MSWFDSFKSGLNNFSSSALNSYLGSGIYNNPRENNNAAKARDMLFGVIDQFKQAGGEKQQQPINYIQQEGQQYVAPPVSQPLGAEQSRVQQYSGSDSPGLASIFNRSFGVDRQSSEANRKRLYEMMNGYNIKL